MQLVTMTQQQTMTSREIAELTGKDHKNVLADIRKMLADLGSAENSANLPDAYGRPQPVLLLDKEQSLCLVAGYSAPLRMAIIKRWQELEAKTALAIPDFSNPALAARAWAEQYEARQWAEQAAALAMATKAEIGSRREATAMNTASQAVKRANQLAAELDQSKQYATIKRMEMLYHGQKFNWRILKEAAAAMDAPAIDVFDQNYGTVKAYHADVWREAYALSIEGLDE